MRYAIYFSPAKDHPLTEAASRWLGRDAFSGTLHDDHSAFADVTAEPRRYGFHATLKAPFELSQKYSEADLLSAFDDFAANQSAFDIPRVVVDALGPFRACSRPHLPTAAGLRRRDRRSFRQVPCSAFRKRYRTPSATEPDGKPAAKSFFVGLSYVMDDFRFHMTLTGRVNDSEATGLRDILTSEFSEFTDRPLSVSGIALFAEETRGAPFAVHRWLPLGHQPKKDATP